MEPDLGFIRIYVAFFDFICNAYVFPAGKQAPQLGKQAKTGDCPDIAGRYQSFPRIFFRLISQAITQIARFSMSKKIVSLMS